VAELAIIDTSRPFPLKNERGGGFGVTGQNFFARLTLHSNDITHATDSPWLQYLLRAVPSLKSTSTVCQDSRQNREVEVSTLILDGKVGGSGRWVTPDIRL
jgi:hypothetical protein